MSVRKLTRAVMRATSALARLLDGTCAPIAGRGVRRMRGQELGHQRQAFATADAVAVQPIHAADRAATPAGRGIATGGFTQTVAHADDHDDPARGRTGQHVVRARRAVKGWDTTLEVQEFQTEVFCYTRRP